MSETRKPGPRGIIKQIWVNPENGENVIYYGCCSTCGCYLPENGWNVCRNGELLCENHRYIHGPWAYCRLCIEEHVISKRECKVLLCLFREVKYGKIAKLTRMSDQQFRDSIIGLAEREYVVVKNNLIYKEYTITDEGLMALKTGAEVFSNDPDYSVTLGVIE